MDIIILVILSYAIYRLAVDYNITPWKWIIRYVSVFLASMIALFLTLIGIFGLNDITSVEKIMMSLAPFVWLYQFILFFFFRARILRYIYTLDQIDKGKKDFPDTPSKEQKDFSYFR
jgi:hypothetical protein